MLEVDLPRFKSAIIDGSYVVLWGVAEHRWLRLHACDGRDGLANGAFQFDDPAGTLPPAELCRSSFPRR